MKYAVIICAMLMSLNVHAFSITVSNSPVGTAVLKAAADSGAEVSFHSKASDAMVKLVKKQADMAVIPLFLAVKMMNDGTDIAVSNLLFGDMLFILNNNGKVKSLEDLKGKKVYLGKGSGPLNLFPRMLFEKAGIMDGIELVGSTAPQIAQLAASGRAKVAVLREPMVTMVMSKNEYVKRAVNFQTEWEKHFGGRFIQAALVVDRQFAAENPETVREYQDKLKAANLWTSENPEGAAEFFASQIPGAKKKIIAASLKSMKPSVEVPDSGELNNFIRLITEYFKDQVGGKVPENMILEAD